MPAGRERLVTDAHRRSLALTGTHWHSLAPARKFWLSSAAAGAQNENRSRRRAANAGANSEGLASEQAAGGCRMVREATKPCKESLDGGQDRKTCSKKRVRPTHLHPDHEGDGSADHLVRFRPGGLRRQGPARTPR